MTKDLQPFGRVQKPSMVLSTTRPKEGTLNPYPWKNRQFITLGQTPSMTPSPLPVASGMPLLSCCLLLQLPWWLQTLCCVVGWVSPSLSYLIPPPQTCTPICLHPPSLPPITGRSCCKYNFCCDKSLVLQQNICFVATKVCLSRQNFCSNKYLLQQA